MWPGANSPLGATWSPVSTNFAVHAPQATALWVCLFDDADVERRLPLTERSLGIWHGEVPDVPAGTRYGYRADGPWDPAQGLLFDPAKLLLDPYARAVSGTMTDHPALFADRADGLDSAPYVPRGVVVGTDDMDWAGETPLRHRWGDTVIYELHVKGMTALHDQVPEHLRGTYAGLAAPAVVDYLRDLGVTAVELLPIHQFVSEPAVLRRGLTNYWGYNTIGFFAPHGTYSASGDRGGQVREFQEMVRTFHASGIEVILDVVYNHTAESDERGPTLSFRGLDDRGFYVQSPPSSTAGGGSSRYWDVTGCGNTVDASDPAALRLILDSLRYWVTEMHVDGFRFDLLSALTRINRKVDMTGHLLSAIGQDPVLRHVKLIAEPWDASPEGYRVGEYPLPWVEWNDRYRDEIRDFWRGRSTGIRTVATRLAGSSDLYADDGRSAYASVNFVTAHDGFTVRDLVSYATKHNRANGERNRDGAVDHRSHNHGVEGEPSREDPRREDILARRRRIASNLMATLCLSNGVPMITAGDERGRTQRGNNNAYCQDNELSWIDWSEDDAWLDVYQTTRSALALRRAHSALRQRLWFEGRPTIVGGPKDLAWLHPSGEELNEHDWHDASLRTLGMFIFGGPMRSPGPHGEQQTDVSFLLWFHSGLEPVEVSLPENHWVQQGEVVLSTDPELAVGRRVQAGGQIVLGPACVLVLREMRED